MRTVYSLDEDGYVLELFQQAPLVDEEDNESYPDLSGDETAITPPDGMYRRRFDRASQTWVDEVTEAELYEMAYREKHRELVAAATEEFVAAKPGYTLEERLMQTLRDMYSMIRELEERLRRLHPDAAPIEPPGYAGDDGNLRDIFDALYNKLVQLEQAQTRTDVEGIKWT